MFQPKPGTFSRHEPSNEAAAFPGAAIEERLAAFVDAPAAHERSVAPETLSVGALAFHVVVIAIVATAASVLALLFGAAAFAQSGSLGLTIFGAIAAAAFTLVGATALLIRRVIPATQRVAAGIGTLVLAGGAIALWVLFGIPV